MISSSSNNQIKNIQKLQKQTKARKEQGLFVIEGKKMFEEALSLPHITVKKAYVTEIYYNEICKGKDSYFRGCEFELVTDSVMKEVSETMTPQGVLALVKLVEYSLDTVLEQERVRLLVLEDIRDPGNLGTMIRTAEGVGITGVVMSRDCVDIYNPKVIRSTMGAIYRVPFVYEQDLSKAVKNMKEHDISVYAAHLEGAVMYDTISYGKKSALLIGNEANGLSSEISNLASQCIKIPMEGAVESLNAGIAAAVLMYEVYRQERRK